MGNDLPRDSLNNKATEIVGWFVQGLGNQAERTLSAYFDRAAAGLVQLLTTEARKYAAKPKYDEVVELVDFGPDRLGRAEVSEDRFSEFRKGVGFQGFRTSLYPQDWFDSSTERDVANALDDSDEIKLWARLQVGDLPILWSGAREYNPDFVAVDSSGVHWLVEVKMDKEMTSADVAGKREAAKRWASFVSNDPSVADQWVYLLASETNVKAAKGSWQALKASA